MPLIALTAQGRGGGAPLICGERDPFRAELVGPRLLPGGASSDVHRKTEYHQNTTLADVVMLPHIFPGPGAFMLPGLLILPGMVEGPDVFMLRDVLGGQVVAMTPQEWT